MATKFRCAQRGCEIPEELTGEELCPVCNNPLVVVGHNDGTSEPVEMPGADDPDPPGTTVRQAAARRNRRV